MNLRKSSSFFVLLLILTFLGNANSATKFYRVDQSGSCSDTVESIIDFSNISVAYSKIGWKFNGAIVVKEVVTDDIGLRILAIRCDTNGANCVQYANRTFDSVCGFISNNPMFGNTFSKFTDPPIKCRPLKATTFTMVDNPVDLSALNFWPIEGYRWKAKFYFRKSHGGLLGCFNAVVTITLTSNRGTKGRG